MSAREELTTALAAVRMSEERRADIARLVERAINEAVDGPDGAKRMGSAYLRGYAEGAKSVESSMFEAINDAASKLRHVGRESAHAAQDALTEYMRIYGYASGLNLDAALVIVEGEKVTT